MLSRRSGYGERGKLQNDRGDTTQRVPNLDSAL